MLSRISFPNKVTIVSIVMLNGFVGILWLVSSFVFATKSSYVFPTGTSETIIQILQVAGWLGVNALVLAATRLGFHQALRPLVELFREHEQQVWLTGLIIAAVLAFVDGFTMTASHVFMTLTWLGLVYEIFLAGMLWFCLTFLTASVVFLYYDQGWGEAGVVGFHTMIFGSWLLIKVVFILIGAYVLFIR